MSLLCPDRLLLLASKLARLVPVRQVHGHANRRKGDARLQLHIQRSDLAKAERGVERHRGRGRPALHRRHPRTARLAQDMVHQIPPDAGANLAVVTRHMPDMAQVAAAPLRLRRDGPETYELGPHDIPPEIADLSAAERDGKSLYQSSCAQCHAADGSGANWIGCLLDPSPPDFTAPEFRDILVSRAFVDRTLRPPSGGSMPSFERVLTRDQVEKIAAYARRAFQKPRDE